MYLLLVNLGGQVVPDVTHSAHRVLHHDRDIGGQRQSDGGAQRGGLGEEGQVAKGKVEVHGLLHVDHDRVIVLVHGGVVLEHNVAGAEVAGGGEADALLGHGDGAGVAEDGNIADNSLELGRRHAHSALVLSVGDAEVLRLNIHKLELKIGHSVLLGGLKNKGKDIGLLFALQGHNVIISGTLQDLGEVGGVNAQSKRLIAAITVEALSF